MTSYRDATTEDRKFVVASWASSYKNSHYAGFIASEDWPSVSHAAIEKLLDRPTTRAIVAYEPGAGAIADFLYGFIAGDTAASTPVVHYVYVKDPYRSESVLAADGNPMRGVDGEPIDRKGPRHARGLFAALGVDPARAFLYTFKTSICAQLGDRRDPACKIPHARFVPAAARYANYHEHNEGRSR